jgi:hypothetical protein
VLPIHDIADKFAELYWRHAAPYEADGSSGRGLVLHQNQGTQAGAISRLVELRSRLPGKRSTLAQARRTPEWGALVTRMRALVKTMPDDSKSGLLQRTNRREMRHARQLWHGTALAQAT